MHQHSLAAAATAAAVLAGLTLVGTPLGAGAARLLTGSDIQNGTVTSADVKNGSLKARDFAAGVLPSSGPSGAVGLQGAPGASGASGAPGASGSPGATGSPGPGGLPGEAGSPGASGAPGASGSPGATGSPGAPGTTGSPGVDARQPSFSTWTVTRAADGLSSATGTSTSTIPAKSLVVGTSLEVTDLTAACAGYWAIAVHDETTGRSLVTQFGGVDQGPVLDTFVIGGTTAHRLAWSVDCFDADLLPAALPALGLTVEFTVLTQGDAPATPFS